MWKQPHNLSCPVYNMQCRLHWPMRKRHLGQRAEVRAGADGLGEHFLNTHGVGLNLKDDKTFNAYNNC